MRQPLVSSTDIYHPIWTGAADLSLRPTMMVVRDGSGFRPVDASELFRASISGQVSVTGIVTVDAVGITGNGGVALDVVNVSGFNAVPVFIVSGGAGGGSSSVNFPAVQATKPALPLNYGTYGINLTGIGVFGNYSTIIPNVTGNPLSLTVEPDSDNGGKVYYAFSGTASTGQAFELRGDKPFDVSGTTSIFFAQVSSGNRVMVHFQVYN